MKPKHVICHMFAETIQVVAPPSFARVIPTLTWLYHRNPFRGFEAQENRILLFCIGLAIGLYNSFGLSSKP